MGTIVFGFLVMIMLLFFSIWLIRVGMNEQKQRAQIRRDGVATTGTIIKRKTRDREPGSVFYSFQHEGQTYTGEQRVSFSHMDQINIGDPVSIRYLPSRPTVALLAGKDEDNPWSVRPIVIGCLILIITLFGAGMVLVFLGR